MSNFAFLKSTNEYALFAPAAIEAERVYSSAPAMCAVGCRKALELAVKWVYSATSGQFRVIYLEVRNRLLKLYHQRSDCAKLLYHAL